MPCGVMPSLPLSHGVCLVRMRHISKSAGKWTHERGYLRNIICAFNDSPDGRTQVQLTEIVAGERVPTHYHQRQTEYLFFLEGSCRLMFRETEIRIQAGDLVIIEPLERHAAYNDSG